MKKIMFLVVALAVSVHSLTFNYAVIEGKKITFEARQYHSVKMCRELIKDCKEKYSKRTIDREEYKNRVNDIFLNMRNIGIYVK